jgi:hypothetical protein
MNISYNDLDKLLPEYLIKINYDYSEAWSVGKPINPPTWRIKILALKKWNSHIDLWTPVYIYATDKIEAIPPQDIIKYINDLTEAGVEYLKNLKL